MVNYESYIKLINSIIDLNYQILNSIHYTDLIDERDVIINKYNEYGCIHNDFTDNELIQLDNVLNQLNETNLLVNKMLEKKIIMLHIKKDILQSRYDNLMDYDI